MSSSYYLHLDESYRDGGRLIAVAGLICAAEDLKSVAEAWIAMRETMDLDEDEPLKWNMSGNNAVRKRLDGAGFDNRERRSRMIDVIREAPITLLAELIYDERGSRRPPIDFYKDALDWLLLLFRNFITDQRPIPPGPHVVVLDQPSPSPPARPTPDPRFSWLVDRQTIWYRIYRAVYEYGWHFPAARNPRVRAMKENGFYPSVVVSHAKFNPLLEMADAVVGLAFDFAYHNIHYAEVGGELPDIAWQDEQFMRIAGKFRSKPNGDILNRGFAIFPQTAPACAEFKGWVTRLCTHERFATFRE